ncbi:MAG: 50S ribosomal protein L13 [Candidatus Odinarchaeia archaeon]
METVTVIDASGAILGRLASHVAKRLLENENIVIINAEKAVISGNKSSIIKSYKQRSQRRTLTAPWKGPFTYRRPDKLVKRTIRGMLPYKTARGRSAYRRLRVYIGVPPEYKDTPHQVIKDASLERLKGPYLTIKELSKELGWSE